MDTILFISVWALMFALTIIILTLKADVKEVYAVSRRVESKQIKNETEMHVLERKIDKLSERHQKNFELMLSLTRKEHIKKSYQRKEDEDEQDREAM